MNPSQLNTEEACRQILQICRRLFVQKLHDYGASWRILRPESLTDQIYIKAERIRSLQTKGCAQVNEGIDVELVAIVN